VVEPDNSGRYTVYYTPVEVGLYNIAVKWNGKEIEGILILRIFRIFYQILFLLCCTDIERNLLKIKNGEMPLPVVYQIYS